MQASEELYKIEQFKIENPDIVNLFKKAYLEKSGVFVKLPTIKTPSLKSYNQLNSTKARPVFIRFPEEIENQNTFFKIYERGTGPKCEKNPRHPKLINKSKKVWTCVIKSCEYEFFDKLNRYSLVHKPHACFHNLIIKDEEFGLKHKNKGKNGKILGPKNRCHGHKHFVKDCKEETCRRAYREYSQTMKSGYPRCELHNGNDCCGIDSDGQMFRESEMIAKLIILKNGSFCFSPNDSRLKVDTLRSVE